jgi:ubiquinone/menaquinone biosynthesis C-methylase UbiE
MIRDFTAADARKFYDRFGSRQDLQAFYENPAIEKLIAHADFEHARAVFELGFGTGRLARTLLERHLPPECKYEGTDISATMEELASEQLKGWPDRVKLAVADGSQKIAAPDRTYDRFISTYVLDMFSRESVRGFLEEAHRMLEPEGKLCLVSLTEGKNRWGRIVTGLWKYVYALKPALVGGCRPVELLEFLDAGYWRIEYTDRVSSFGITSEIVIAAPLFPAHLGSR